MIGAPFSVLQKSLSLSVFTASLFAKDLYNGCYSLGERWCGGRQSTGGKLEGGRLADSLLGNKLWYLLMDPVSSRIFFFPAVCLLFFFFFFFPSAFHALFFSIKHRQYATFYGLYALLEFHLLDVLTLSPLVYRITQQDATRTPLNAFDAAAHIRPIHCRWQSLRSLSTQNVTKCCSGFFLFWIICQTWTKMETKSTLHSSKVSPQRC